MKTEERLAILETQIKDIPEIKDDVKAIRQDVGEMKESLRGQRGFISGAVMVLSTIATFIVALIMTAWEKIAGTFWP